MAPPSRISSRAATGVLELLAAAGGPVTAAELATRAGQHTNTVREHLDSLVENGLATRERAAADGRGRPAWLYTVVPVEPEHSEYAGLATALALQIARTSSRPAEEAQAAGAAWGEQLATTAPAAPSTSAAARRGVVELLGRLGFDPEADARARTVQLRQCPLLQAAKAQPEVVCSVHLGLVKGALATWRTAGEGTELVPFAEPGACLLHLSGTTAPDA